MEIPRLSGRLPELDGLRGVAVLIVMAFHFSYFGCGTATGFWNRTYSSVTGLGWAGVDLFFVLSGFLITGILYDSRTNPRYYRVFYARRTVRIFPLYYVTLVMVFWIIPWTFKRLGRSNPIYSTPLAAQMLAWSYLLNWGTVFPALGAVTTVIAHFWSLSIEEQFYFLWPLVVRMSMRRSLLFVCAALIVVSPVLRFAAYALHLPQAAYEFTFCRMDGLALGAILALAIRDARNWAFVRRLAPYGMAFAVTGLAGVIAVVRSPGFGNIWMDTLGISFIALFFGSSLVKTLDLNGGLMRQVASWRFLRFFGKYSYCLYICHQPLILILARLGVNANHLAVLLHGRFLAVVVVNFVALSASVLIALLSWNVLEKQFLKLKERPALKLFDGETETKIHPNKGSVTNTTELGVGGG
jgi:peptidoglycan/LPS O-acetylase OafA/YrhL